MGYGDFNIDLPDGANLAPDEGRVTALMDLMPDQPYHPARPFRDAEDWKKITSSTVGKSLLEQAQRLASEPIIPYTNEMFLHAFEKQDRTQVEPAIYGVLNRLAVFPVAECLERQGRYLDPLEKEIEAILQVKAWNFPTHEQSMEFFEGKTEWVDLIATHFAGNLVHAIHLLEEKLKPELVQRVSAEIERRIFQPFEKRIQTGKDVWWWIPCEHNWNSVCLAGILSCALRLKTDPRERAWYVALVEDLIRNSEKGFTESGFYEEGVSYWNYGFGHYVLAGELMRAVTGGQIDLLRKPKSERMCHFGARMVIQDGVYPSFSDCGRDLKLPGWLKNWLNNRVDPQRQERCRLVRIDSFDGVGCRNGTLMDMLLFLQEDINEAYALSYSRQPREWFPDAQFLICRPREDSKTRMAATFKGGDNGVNHSHNDLGTFTVLIGGIELLADPGSEVYNKRTFSKYRYECDLLNSFGHPVPVVAGELQRPAKDEHNSREGRKYHSVVKSASFSGERDTVTLDLLKAYVVDSLELLERTFTYMRGERETVEVTDRVRYSRPEAFETALITYEHWEIREDGIVVVWNGDEAVQVRVDSADGEMEFNHRVIQESSTPTRLSWRFREPVQSASVTLTVSPV